MHFEMDRLLAYDNESLIDEILRVVALLPEGPISRLAFGAKSRVSTSTLVRRFGGWENVLVSADLAERYGGRTVSAKMRNQNARSLSADQVTDELRVISRKVGSKTITRADVVEHSNLIGDRVINNRFGSWAAALEAAGLEVSAHGRRWTEEDYFENLLEVWTHYGKAPTYSQMALPPSRISPGGYEAKFGTWGKAKFAFVERVNSDVSVEEAEQEMPALPRPTQPRAKQEDQRHIPIGIRYQVLKRASFRCMSCGRSPATEAGCVLHVDHVTPFSKGGKTRADNLQSLCESCNLGKSNRH